MQVFVTLECDGTDFQSRCYVILLLLFPTILCQGGFLHLCLMSERTDMVIIYVLKISFCSSYVNFIRVTKCWDYTFMNYVFSSAFAPQRTDFFFPAITWLHTIIAWINQFLVVWFDNISHIQCPTVAYLHIIPNENFMELVQRSKMQIYLLKELLCDISNDCATIRWGKPYDVTVTLSF